GPIERVHGDLLNREDVTRAIRGCEVVFHLICTTLPRSSNDNPVYDVETNVVATLRLLEAARTEGVGKIVFLSSGGTVYGVPPTNTICSYGITKLTIEKYFHMFREIQVLTMRSCAPQTRSARISIHDAARVRSRRSLIGPSAVSRLRFGATAR